MEKYNKILWVASYPKSGNTWLRSILAGLFFTSDGVFDFNLLKNISSFEKIKFYNYIKDKDGSNFKNLDKIEIISQYWLEAQNFFLLSLGGKSAFLKTHSCNISLNNNPFTSPNVTLGLVYLIRNPLDICISYSKHLGISIDEAIKYMISNKTISFFEDKEKKKYPFPLGRWDEHVSSWENIKSKKIIIRYEDFLEKKNETLLNLIFFFENELNIGVENKEEKIANILKTTRFDQMKENERKYGFKEATKHSVFFRSGKNDQWKKELNLAQKDIILNEFNLLMKKYNYL